MNFKKVHPDFGIEIKNIKINKINLNEITENESDGENSATNDEISFIPLDEQLKLHAKAADSYGEKIVSLVS